MLFFFRVGFYSKYRSIGNFFGISKSKILTVLYIRIKALKVANQIYKDEVQL